MIETGVYTSTSSQLIRTRRSRTIRRCPWTTEPDNHGNYGVLGSNSGLSEYDQGGLSNHGPSNHISRTDISCLPNGNLECCDKLLSYLRPLEYCATLHSPLSVTSTLNLPPSNLPGCQARHLAGGLGCRERSFRTLGLQVISSLHIVNISQVYIVIII